MASNLSFRVPISFRVYVYFGGIVLLMPVSSSAGFPGDSVVKNLPANAGDVRDTCLIPGLGRSHGLGNGKLLHYFSLENYMSRGAWQATVHGVAKSQTQLK